MVKRICFLLAVILIVDVVLSGLGRDDLLCFYAVTVGAVTTHCMYLEVFYVIQKNRYQENKKECICKCAKEKVGNLIRTLYTQNQNRDTSDKDNDEVSSRTASTVSCTDNKNIIPFKQSIEKMTHWSQIVSTTIGYELFIGHLESEFSIETMLFITDVCTVFITVHAAWLGIDKPKRNNVCGRPNQDLLANKKHFCHIYNLYTINTDI